MWTANQGHFGVLTRGTGVGEFVPITVGNSTITNAPESITLKTPSLKFDFGSTTAITSFAQASSYSSWSANQLVTADQIKAVLAAYLTSSDASTTYATIASLSNYLLATTAASTYQTQAGMSSYLTTSAASNTYATIASLGSYLTSATAASTYQTQAGMSNYLTTTDATSTYVPITAGNSTITNSSSDITLKTSTLKFTFGSTTTSITSFATDFDTWTNSQIATALQIKNAILNSNSGRVVHTANITSPNIGFYCEVTGTITSDLTPNVQTTTGNGPNTVGIIIDSTHYVTYGPVVVKVDNSSYSVGENLRPGSNGAQKCSEVDLGYLASYGCPHVRITCMDTSIVPQIDGHKCYACFIS
jgi:hypothetical protein